MIVNAFHCLDGGRGTDSPPRHPRLTSPHRLRTDSTTRVTICLRIGAGVAKFSRAKPVYSAPNDIMLRRTPLRPAIGGICRRQFVKDFLDRDIGHSNYRLTPYATRRYSNGNGLWPPTVYQSLLS